LVIPDRRSDLTAARVAAAAVAEAEEVETVVALEDVM
jgi:hypothetical protein